MSRLRFLLRYRLVIGLGSLALVLTITYQFLSDPIFSDENILVVSDEYNWPKDYIFMMLPDGSRQRRLERGFDPACSPDGHRIAFAAPDDSLLPNSKRYDQIFIMDVNRSNVKQLTSDSSPKFTPAWSPDGQFLAFGSYSESVPRTPIWHIDIIDLRDMTITRPIDQNWSVSYPAWSPDGKQIVVSAFNHRTEASGLYLTDTKGNYMTRLTYDFDRQPDWSPDGKYIAYLYRPAGVEMSSTIRVIGSDGSNPIDIVPAKYQPRSLKWSPDGKRIVFVGHTESGDGVFVINSDGSGLTPITQLGKKVLGAEGGVIPLLRNVFYEKVTWCKVK